MAERIREAVRPDRIVLFGSQARGKVRADSDIDLLVVAPSKEPRGRRAIPLYAMLAGSGAAKDIVWWTPEEVSEWSGVRSHFVTAALREGTVLYEKPA